MSFIHFGCWNKGYCDLDKKNNGMSAVINYLLSEQSPRPKFYIVAGDNYYPEKIGDKKILNVQNLKSGMDCINSLKDNAPIYMLMGNHDVQYENTLHDTTEKKVDKCSIIQNEMLYGEDFNFNRYAVMLNDNTLCLFMNSMFYTSDKDEIFDCIKQYREDDYKNANSIEDIIHYDETVLNEILRIISSKFNITNLVIAAHDPILTRREKKAKEKKGKKVPGKSVRSPLLNDGIRFLDKLYGALPDAKKYYLCADTHQYQEGIIKLGNNTIVQYVVGTGGTDCDDDNIIPDDDFINIPNMDIKLEYKLQKIVKAFGFLYCREDKTNLLFDFIPVTDCNLNQAGGTVRKKRKTVRRKKGGIQKHKRTSRRKRRTIKKK